LQEFPFQYTTHITNMAAVEIESSQAPYLRSLLDPKSGPAYIPDDLLMMCKTRSEPITTNVTAPASGQGLFVFYPNNPTGLVGHHYIFNIATSNYVYDGVTGAIRTAQSLRDNYNFGRLVSQLVEVRSSTLPAGVYALNGTFNAVTVYEGLSELSSTGITYNSILQSTTEILDKVGNVLVGDGVAILTLPNSFDLPFARFNDISPTAYSSGGVAAFGGSVIASDNNSQITTIAGSWPSLPAGATLPLFTQNVDSTNQIEITGQLSIQAAAALATPTTVLQVEILDAFGGVIVTNSVVARIPPLAAAVPAVVPFSYMVPSSFYTTSSQPVAAVRFSFATNNLVAGTSLAINGRINAINAAYPGVNYPITVVAYQGVAQNTQITISGVANYELLPNALLKRNLDVSYAPYRKKEMAYVKAIMAMRQRLELRTVQPIPEYRSKLALYHELASLDQHNLAMAFDWGDLIRGLKNIASPILSTFFPLASPLIGAAGNAIDAAVDYFTPVQSSTGDQKVEFRNSQARSMSGTAVGYPARSMSGAPIGFSMSGSPIGRSMSGRAIGYSSSSRTAQSSGRATSSGAPLVYKAMASDTGYVKYDNESKVLAMAKDDDETGGTFSCVLKKENRRKGKKVEAALEYKPVEAEEPPVAANVEVASAMDTVTPISFLSGEVEHGLIGGTELDIGFEGLTPRGVLFPVVIERDGLGMKTASYIAVPGDFRSKLPADSRDIYCESQTGRRIYGHTGDLTHVKLMSDMTVLPVAEIRGGRKCFVQTYAPPVAGTSCVAALICADKGKFSGVKAMQVTGNVRLNRNGRLTLIPNPAAFVKLEYCRKIGLPLAEGSVQKYSFIQNVLAALDTSDPCDKVLSQVNLENQVQAVRELAMSLAWAADEEFFPAPPPDDEPSYEELMEDWKFITTKLCDIDQGFSKLIDVTNWLTMNDLTETMHKFIKKPTAARVFPVLIANITPGAVVYKREGAQDTPAQAQWKRFVRLADNLRSQYPDITPEWIEMNSGRGPSQEQARYFSYNRVLPAPGTVPGVMTASLRDKVLAAYPMATAEQRQQLADYIETHGTGPNQEVMKSIFSKRPDITKLESYIMKVATDNKLDESETAMVRDRVMANGRGLTQEELAEVLYSGGARVRPSRAPAPSRLITGGSGAPIFNRVEQAPAPRNSRLARFIGASEQGNVGSEIL
jgi:hypothetical protein